MSLKYTTPVPNVVFDSHLPTLTESELKVLLVVIRQTYGWIDRRTGKRKTRDRISHQQFIAKTGLSRRVLSKTLKNLIAKQLICITDFQGRILRQPEDRTGRSYLYYSPTCALNDQNLCTWRQQPVHNSAYNKRNYIKNTRTKERDESIRSYSTRHIGEIIAFMR